MQKGVGIPTMEIMNSLFLESCPHSPQLLNHSAKTPQSTSKLYAQRVHLHRFEVLAVGHTELNYQQGTSRSHCELSLGVILNK